MKNFHHITKNCVRPPYCKMAPTKTAAKQKRVRVELRSFTPQPCLFTFAYQSRPYEYQLDQSRTYEY